MKYNNLRKRLIKSMITDINASGMTVPINMIYYFSVVLLFVGSCYHAVVYYIYGSIFEFAAMVFLTGFLFLIFRLFKKHVLNANKAVIANAFVLTAAMCTVMLAKAVNPCRNAVELILVELNIVLIPAVLTCFTTYRKLAPVFTALILITYGICSVLLDSFTMKAAIPVFVTVILGVQSILIYLFIINDKMKKKNMRLTNEQKSYINFFNMSYEQWMQVKEGKLDREQAEAILRKFEDDIREKIVYRLKETIRSEEKVKEILSRTHPSFTLEEKKLCCYILQGKSVTEIARIKEITESAVTNMRSRIRGKIELQQNDSLKGYLESLVRGYSDDSSL